MTARRVVCATKIEEARPGRGEDRIASIERDGQTIFVVVDGAGGTSGGAAAADAICRALATHKGAFPDWVTWLARCDRIMVASGAAGLAAAAVVSVSDDGMVSGASVGDCGAWVFGQGAPGELTERQFRKPLLGENRARPVAFAAQLSKNGTLVVATDGLWKYADRARIADQALQRPMESAAAALIDGVRLKSGALQDDVAVMICAMTDEE